MTETLVPGQTLTTTERCKLCGQEAYEWTQKWVQQDPKHSGMWDVISERAINVGTCPNGTQGRHTITGM